MKQFTSEELFTKVNKFLERASQRFSKEITDQERALEIAGGNFWNEDNKKRWGVYDKDNPEGSLIPLLAYNNISAQVNSIGSPFSKSPFHVNIINKNDGFKDIQNLVSKYEGSNIAKNIYNKAFIRGITCSAGYVAVGTDLENNSIVPKLEFCSNQSMVAFDPDCITPDGSDAEEGALISYIPVSKARRKYGEDVCPAEYPKQDTRLSFANSRAWGNIKDKIQEVRYFMKDEIENPETGEKRTIVCMYILCGDKILTLNEETGEPSPIILTTEFIPIVRFAGYNDYSKDYGAVYTGFVQKTLPHIEMMSLALTLQATRMRRCSNVRYMGPADAIEGCETYFRDYEKGTSMGLLWNPKSAGVTLTNDTFQVADISAVMNEVRIAMQDMSGVNLQGLQPTEKTATEVMQQQINSESNVQELYLNAEAACNTLAKIVLGIFCKGDVPEFTLEGGPSVITSMMKERAEIQAIATMVPPEQQTLLAIRMAETIESDVGKSLTQDLKANCGLSLTEGKDVGGMTNICNQMKNTLDQTMQALEQKNAELAEAQKQLEEMERQLNDAKEQRQLDFLKWQAEMNFKEAQMQVDNAQVAKKLEQEDNKLMLEASNMRMKNAENNSKVAADAQREQIKLQSEMFKAQAEQKRIEQQMQIDEIKARREAEKADRDMRRDNERYAIERMRATDKYNMDKRRMDDDFNRKNMLNFNPMR